LLIFIGILIVRGDYQTISVLAAKWQAKLSGGAP
jgi:hypothetical protein